MVLILTLLFGLMTPFALVPVAHADDINNQVCKQAAANGNGTPIVCQKSTANPVFGPDGILTKVARVLAVLTAIIAVFMIMVAGFRYITSNADGSTLASAKQSIIYAIVGLVVAALAQGIVSFVLVKL